MKIISILFFSIFLSGCALPIAYQLNPSPTKSYKQLTMYESGVTKIVSKGQQTILSLRPLKGVYERQEDLHTFVVTMKNNSNTPVNFPVEVTAIHTSGEPLKIYSLADIEEWKEAKRKQEAIAAGMMAFSGGMNAAYGTPMAGAETFISQTGDRMNMHDEKAQQYASTTLKIQTVMPGKMHGGLIYVEKPDLDNGSFVISVKASSVDGSEEVHGFNIIPNKAF